MSRRSFITSGVACVGIAGLGPRAFARPAPGCLLTPEQEQGPFYVGGEMLRSSIAEGKPGVPLSLRIVVFDQATCAPLRNAAIDLWHCDAMGLYSGFTASKGFGPPGDGPHGPDGPDGPNGGPPPGFDPSHGPPPGFDPAHAHGMPTHKPTDKLTFLRGIQMTGGDGAVTYNTIFPGFYQGRVNHIHFKVRLEGHRTGDTYSAGHISHTGQIFFPEEINLHLMTQQPYASHQIHRTTMNEDHVFNGEHGSLASIHPLDAHSVSGGFAAEYHAAVDPAATPAGVQMGPG